MSEFATPSRPYFTQGWNAWLMERHLTKGDTLCPYHFGFRMNEWWSGYKAASYHYMGSPWLRAAIKHGVEI